MRWKYHHLRRSSVDQAAKGIPSCTALLYGDNYQGYVLQRLLVDATYRAAEELELHFFGELLKSEITFARSRPVCLSSRGLYIFVRVEDMVSDSPLQNDGIYD
jgi:hypothetical protein